jgi:transcription antitermination factor NusG
MNFVGVGSTPVPIPDADIESLQRLNASLKVKPWPFLRLGQKVRIERGPLAGVEGIIESFRSGFRIVVSIELLQRSVAAEVQGDLLEPLVAWSTKSGEEGLERAARS